jgi:ribosomal protein S18 acetylase RimI-like enzyme
VTALSGSGEVRQLEIRRVRPGDWPDLRELRLEALEDTPLGFLETLASAQEQPDDVWRARAARGAEGGESFQVMAWDDGRPVGNCVCFLRDGAAWLAAVYVTPGHRGQGLLADLAERCAEWGREQGCTVLRLEVHEDNARAQAAYARLGFRDTGLRAPYTLPPGGQELIMERAL